MICVDFWEVGEFGKDSLDGCFSRVLILRTCFSMF